ncbi:multi protein bridging factor 1-domain-containing protein [Cyathus striatus]|nr:multi protein bridging factor 1-domain-containing protein [Cyathus striatus]
MSHTYINTSLVGSVLHVSPINFCLFYYSAFLTCSTLFTMSTDWDSTTVIGHKRHIPKVTKKDSDLNGARRTGAVVATDKKIAAGGNKAHQGTDHQRIAKLDRENEVAPPPKIAPSVGRAIQAARMELKLSQKDLAQKINEKPSVLQDYESGKAIPNPQILAKTERILGVKLRGSDIGKKLEGKK